MDFTRIVLIFSSLTLSWCFSIPLLSENDLTSKTESDSSISVFLTYKKDVDATIQIPLNALENASQTLNQHGTQLGVVNCTQSSNKLCQTYAPNDVLLLFKSGEVIKEITPKTIQTKAQAEGKILHWMNEDILTRIETEKDWEKFNDEMDGKHNFVFALIPKLGTKFHNYLIQMAITFKDSIKFAYTTSYNLANSCTQFQNEKRGAVWSSMCSVGKMQSQCTLFRHLYPYNSAALSDTFRKMATVPLVTMIDGKEPADSLKSALDKAEEMKQWTVLLIAGKGKLERATLLAKQFCAEKYSHANCIVVNGNVEGKEMSEYIKDGRIHLSVIPTTEQLSPQETLLISETFGEIKEQYNMLKDRLLDLEGGILSEQNQVELGLEDQEIDADDAELQRAEMQQDDPVAFSVHYNKYMKDLYLYDFKTLSRLTDVTYPRVVNGTDYAAVLFTLEFNSKSLAAVSIFANVHNEMKDASASPLHWVECFNWPDICYAEDISTFPRLFFYRQGIDRTPIEYRGTWSEKKLKESVVLHSVPWPIVSPDEGFMSSIPNSVTVNAAFTGTKEGKEIFIEVAEKYGGKSAFALFDQHKDLETVRFMAKALKLKDWKKKNTVIRAVGEKMFGFTHFESADELEKFVNPKEDFIQITEENFDALMNDDKPLVIQYLNVSSPVGSMKTQQEKLFQVLREISTQDAGARTSFAWIDSSPSSAGEYALAMHTGGQSLLAPLVFLNKKENYITAKSFESGVSNGGVSSWVDDCLKRKPEATATLRENDWKARIEGYNFLEYLRIEGALPSSKEFLEESPETESEDDSTDEEEEYESFEDVDLLEEVSHSAVKHTEL